MADGGVAGELSRRFISDGLSNVLTGLGGGASNYKWSFTETNYQELDKLYRTSWVARKIVDIIAEDMTFKWREWSGVSDARLRLLQETEKRLEVQTIVRTAIQQARAFGGAAIIAQDGNGDLDKPMGNGGKNSLRYIFCVPKFQLTAHGQMNVAPGTDGFGMAKFYTLDLGAGTPSMVHHSRIAIINGKQRLYMNTSSDGFGDSVLEDMKEEITNIEIAIASVTRLIESARIDVIKMNNIANMLGTDDGEKMLAKRLANISLGKGVMKTLLLSETEEYVSTSYNFSSLDKILDILLKIPAGGVNVPITRFLSQSPAGMNATGESDLRNYAQTIHSRQASDLTPALLKLDGWLIKSAIGSIPPKLTYSWPSIYTVSQKEEAEINKINSEADKNYMDSNLVDGDALMIAVGQRLRNSGIYPGYEPLVVE